MNTPLLPCYHKIQSPFKRDPETKFKTFLPEWALPEFEYLADAQWEWTEKIDGTNTRIHIEDDGRAYAIGGRTPRAEMRQDLGMILHGIGARATSSGELNGLTLFGEGYGAGIQKGGGNYNPDGVDFILFDVMVTETGVFLERENVEDIAVGLGIDVVQVVERGTLSAAIDAVHYWAMPSALGFGDFQMEGLVLRPLVELRGRLGRRIITKIKRKDFPDELA